MIKTEDCETAVSPTKLLEETPKTENIEIKRKYNNESLFFIRFLKQKLHIQANFVYLYQKTGFVIVSKKPVVATNTWNEYINKTNQFADYNIQFVKEKENWTFKDFVNILLPQISIISINTDGTEIILKIPAGQLKFAMGKNKQHLDLLNNFVKECTCFKEICFEAQSK